MPYDFTYMWNLMNKINKKTHRHRKQTDCCQRERRLVDWVKRVKGLRKNHNS